MADNIETIFINYEVSGDEDYQKKIEAIKNSERELVNEIQKTATGFNDLSATAAKSLNNVATGQQKFSASNKNLQNELSGTKKTVDDLSKSTTVLDEQMRKSAGPTTFVGQLKRMKATLQEMEDAGLSGTVQFRNLSIAAAKLEDQIGDTRQQVRALASDTKNLDAVMNLGTGLAGAFNVATSAAALFGGKNEELTQAFLKVQAALSILNGVQAVANVLNKDSVANVVLKNIFLKQNVAAQAAAATATAATAAATGAEATATVTATVATKAWTRALLSNPVFIIGAVILGVVFAISKLVHAMGEEERARQRAIDSEKIRIDLRAKTNEQIKVEYDLKKAQYEREIALAESIENNEENVSKLKKERLESELKLRDELYKKNEQEVLKLEENKKLQKELQEQVVKTEIGSIYLSKEKTKERIEYLKKELENVEAKIKIGTDVSEGLKNAKVAIEIFDNQQVNAEKAKRETRSKEAEKAAQELAKATLVATAEAASVAYEREVFLQEKTNEELLILKIAALEKEREVAIKLVQKGAIDEALQREKIQLDFEKKTQAARLDVLKLNVDEELSINAALAAQLAEQKLYFEKKKYTELAEIEKEELDKLLIFELDLQKKKVELKTKQSLLGVREGSAREKEIVAEKEKELSALEISFATLTNEKILAEKIKLFEKENSAKIASLNEQIEAEKKLQESAVYGVLYKQQSIARERELTLEKISLEQAMNDEGYKNGLINLSDYLSRKKTLTEQAQQVELANFQDVEAAKTEALKKTYELGMELVSLYFQAQQNELQAELDDNKKYYDEQLALLEAHRYDKEMSDATYNATKEQLQKEQLEKEKEIKKRMAQQQKEQAIFQALINGALAVTMALATNPFPYSLIVAGIVAALTAVQVAKIASQKTPAYAKGRKGGKGELAWVGEQGAELMYVPAGASIVPHKKSKNFNESIAREYNIPNFSIDKTSTTAVAGQSIDYEKLGTVVARNIAQNLPPMLNISLDENGFKKYLQSENERASFLNSKIKW